MTDYSPEAAEAAHYIFRAYLCPCMAAPAGMVVGCPVDCQKERVAALATIIHIHCGQAKHPDTAAEQTNV